MTDGELDELYTALCRLLTECGADRAPLVLARFALLAMLEIDDPARVRSLIASARLDDPV